MFRDLQEGISDIFECAQSMYPEGIALISGKADYVTRRRSVALMEAGFHIDPKSEVRRSGPNSYHRKKYLRDWAKEKYETKVQERLMAGERPVFGKIGRQPSVWVRVAARLGIQLDTTPVQGTSRSSKDARQKKLCARILAGERPSFARRPPTAWLRAAESLGIDIQPAPVVT